VAEPRSDDLLRSREEAALLLRLDPQNLSASDALRCDLIATLRLSIDSAQADALEGRAADLGRLIVATESLVKLLPSEPPKLASSRVDPRETMWQTYKAMRDRGELFFQKTERAQLLDEIAALRAENAQLRGETTVPCGSVEPQPCPPSALPPNVFLSRPSLKDAPAAAPAPAPANERTSERSDVSPSPPAQPNMVDLRRGYSTTAPEPWRPFVEGGAFYDRWSNRN
jgi:hypothetical protein